MLVHDGFPGQRLRVLPRPLVESALQRPVTSRLLVTDVGFFPYAAAHGRHRRDGAAEAIVIVCVGGRGVLDVGGVSHAVSPGHAVLIPPGVPHLYLSDERDPWSIWWMHVMGTDVNELVSAAVGEPARPVVALRDPHLAVSSLDQVVSALEQDETEPSLYLASGAAWRLLAQLGSDRLLGPLETSDRIRIAQEYIRHNLADRISLTDLARRTGLSSSHFAALFKSATGLPVMEYLKRLRCARARELLMTSSRTIAEVGREVGYSDAFYFSRQFSAVNGVSPRGFREKSRREDVSAFR